MFTALMKIIEAVSVNVSYNAVASFVTTFTSRTKLDKAGGQL